MSRFTIRTAALGSAGRHRTRRMSARREPGAAARRQHRHGRRLVDGHRLRSGDPAPHRLRLLPPRPGVLLLRWHRDRPVARHPRLPGRARRRRNRPLGRRHPRPLAGRRRPHRRDRAELRGARLPERHARHPRRLQDAHRGTRVRRGRHRHQHRERPHPRHRRRGPLRRRLRHRRHHRPRRHQQRGQHRHLPRGRVEGQHGAELVHPRQRLRRHHAAGADDDPGRHHVHLPHDGPRGHRRRRVERQRHPQQRHRPELLRRHLPLQELRRVRHAEARPVVAAPHRLERQPHRGQRHLRRAERGVDRLTHGREHLLPRLQRPHVHRERRDRDPARLRTVEHGQLEPVRRHRARRARRGRRQHGGRQPVLGRPLVRHVPRVGGGAGRHEVPHRDAAPARERDGRHRQPGRARRRGDALRLDPRRDGHHVRRRPGRGHARRRWAPGRSPPSTSSCSSPASPSPPDGTARTWAPPRRTGERRPYRQRFTDRCSPGGSR